MILYLLDHRRWIDSEYYDTKFIGIYSSYSNLSRTLERYSKIPGFCDFVSGFHIESHQISINKKSKKMHLYLLTTTHILDEDEITVSYSIYSNAFLAKLIWVYKSITSHKKNFYVEKYCIDEDNWSEGFLVTS